MTGDDATQPSDRGHEDGPDPGVCRNRGTASDAVSPGTGLEPASTFLRGSGAMGERIRALDWLATPLGAMETWPQSLKLATGMMLTAAMPIAVFWGSELTLLYNDPFAAFVSEGHPRPLGRPAQEVMAGLWDTVGPILAGVMAGRGAVAMHDQRFLLRRGVPAQEAWFDASFNPLPNDDGSIGGVWLVGAETTQRVRAEQALRESERQYRELVRCAPAGIYEIDFWQNRLVSVNDAICQMLGYNREELLEIDPFDLLDSDSRARFRDRVARWLGGEEPERNVEFRVKSREGRCIDAILSVTFTRDQAGQPLGATVVAHDITERKRAETALRQAHDELEMRVQERTAELSQANRRLEEEMERKTRTERALRLEESRLDALLRLSRMGDAPTTEIAGFVLEQGIAQTQSRIGFVGFLSPDESSYTLDAVSKEVLKECAVPGDPVKWHIGDAGIWADAIRRRTTLFVNDYSQPHPRKKGLPPGHPYVERFMVVPILEGQHVVAVAGVGNKATDYDRSDERQIALLLDGMWRCVQRKQAQEALLEAERSSAMGRIVASVAHEINNPLQGVVGCLGLARELVEDDEDAARYMDVAIGELGRAARIVQQMRDLGRRDEGRRRLADVGELMGTVLTLTRHRARSQGIQVIYEGGDPLAPVSVVPDRVQQVFLNLVLNAIDAMSQGGELRILAANTAEPVGVQLSFADAGMGIAPDALENLFAAFHSTKQLGLGLGLYVSRNVVEQHGGWIDVRSQVGRGTTFTVWLPAAAPGYPEGERPAE